MDRRCDRVPGGQGRMAHGTRSHLGYGGHAHDKEKREMTSPSIRVQAGLLAAFALIVAACTSGGAATSAPPTAPPSATAGPTVSGVWVRPPMAPGRPAAGYLTIVGGATVDALVGASSPIAGSVEIHETMPGASGMMAMQPVAKIDIPAGGTVALEPGGYHLMLMELKEEPKVGSTVELTLTFEGAGDVVVKAEVRAS